MPCLPACTLRPAPGTLRSKPLCARSRSQPARDSRRRGLHRCRHVASVLLLARLTGAPTRSRELGAARRDTKANQTNEQNEHRSRRTERSAMISSRRRSSCTGQCDTTRSRPNDAQTPQAHQRSLTRITKHKHNHNHTSARVAGNFGACSHSGCVTKSRRASRAASQSTRVSITRVREIGLTHERARRARGCFAVLVASADLGSGCHTGRRGSKVASQFFTRNVQYVVVVVVGLVVITTSTAMTMLSRVLESLARSTTTAAMPSLFGWYTSLPNYHRGARVFASNAPNAPCVQESQSLRSTSRDLASGRQFALLGAGWSPASSAMTKSAARMLEQFASLSSGQGKEVKAQHKNYFSDVIDDETALDLNYGPTRALNLCMLLTYDKSSNDETKVSGQALFR